MSEEPNPYSPPSSPIESTQGGRPQPSSIGPLVYLVGWSWPLVLALFGVAADRVRIPTPTKIVLSITSLLLPGLVIRFGGRLRWGCASLLAACCVLAVMVMWFWN
jgi:hypothetical protein